MREEGILNQLATIRILAQEVPSVTADYTDCKTLLPSRCDFAGRVISPRTHANVLKAHILTAVIDVAEEAIPGLAGVFSGNLLGDELPFKIFWPRR